LKITILNLSRLGYGLQRDSEVMFIG